MKTLDRLSKKEIFSRQDYYDAYMKQFGEQNPFAIDYALRKAIGDGSIVHIGRDQYANRKAKHCYRYKYSDAAVQIASQIKEEYPFADFRIFELVQLNVFVNHLFAHNTIFISVENDLMDYVFDSLRNEYPGKIMFKPQYEYYNRYLVDGQIVIIRLPSETPKGLDEPWHSRLEKILVDITVDKLMSRIISPSEYYSIFTEAFDRYLIDENAMIRYANRKGAGQKFRRYLMEYTRKLVEE